MSCPFDGYVFWRRPIPAGWIDRVSADGAPIVEFMPASTLYHVFGAVTEAHRVTVRGLELEADALGLVAAVENGLPPRPVLQIPGDGLGDPGLEGFLRAPAQFVFDLRGVDGVAPVVAGTIGDERDQPRRGPRAEGSSRSSRSQIVSTTCRLVRSLRPPIL